MKEEIITKEYLADHPDEIFVFGDNIDRVGCGGAAMLRYEPNVYGFVTKKKPSSRDEDYYRVEEYRPVFASELKKLIVEMYNNQDKTYLISRLGAGLANKYHIWEELVEPHLKLILGKLPNVRFLYEGDL